MNETLEQTIQTDKMATLGTLIAGIIHEMNTPAGAINAAIVNMHHHLQLLIDSFSIRDEQGMSRDDFQRLMVIVTDMASALDGRPQRHSSAIREEQKGLIELLQEREIPNSRELAKQLARLDLSGHIEDILVFAQQYDLGEILAFLTHWSRIITSASDIKLSSAMLMRMIQAIKSYSYPRQEKPALANIHESIDIALTILKNKLKHQIQVKLTYGELPNIWCYASELTHVWLNLLHNAIQAIAGQGEIRIETFLSETHLEVRITDNGSGIPAEIQDRIFEPNFTTKPPGEGTGFGLSLVRRIIEKHQGSITVTSVPGNTTFEVRLPLSLPLYDLSEPTENENEGNA